MQISKFLKDPKVKNKEDVKSSAKSYIEKAENFLVEKNIQGIELLNIATKLDPSLHLQKSKIIFDFIKTINRKTLLRSINEILNSINDQSCSKSIFYNADSLKVIAKLTKNQSYLKQALEKNQKAILLEINKKILAKLYYQKASIWFDLFYFSKEAFDIKNAILNYEKIKPYFKNNIAFLKKIGSSYYEMGLLTNDNNCYLKSIEFFYKILKSKKQPAILYKIANSFRELYINTSEDIFFQKASNAYKSYNDLTPNNTNVILEWTELLCEYGKNKKDLNALKLAIEVSKFKNNVKCFAKREEAKCYFSLFSGEQKNINQFIKNLKSYKRYNFYKKFLFYSHAQILKAKSIYFNFEPYYEKLAIQKLQNALKMDNSAEIWQSLANSYSKLGLYFEDCKLLKKAKNCFEKANNLKPSCFSILFDYSKFCLKTYDLLEELSFLKKSLSLIEEAIKIRFFKSENILFTYSNILLKLGDYFLEKHLIFDSSLTFYKKSLHNFKKINKNYKNINFYIGVAYSKIGDITSEKIFFEKSINYFEKEISINSENDTAYLELSLSYISYAEEDSFLHNNLYKKAHFALKKAGALGNLHSYYFLACLYSILNKEKLSIDFLKKAKEHEILPETEELFTDLWLKNIQKTDSFKIFINSLEENSNLNQ